MCVCVCTPRWFMQAVAFIATGWSTLWQSSTSQAANTIRVSIAALPDRHSCFPLHLLLKESLLLRVSSHKWCVSKDNVDVRVVILRCSVVFYVGACRSGLEQENRAEAVAPVAEHSCWQHLLWCLTSCWIYMWGSACFNTVSNILRLFHRKKDICV